MSLFYRLLLSNVSKFLSLLSLIFFWMRSQKKQAGGHRQGRAQKRPKANAVKYPRQSLGYLVKSFVQIEGSFQHVVCSTCSLNLTYRLKSSLPHLMKTETMPTKRATKAQAVTHCGTPDMWCHPCQLMSLHIRYCMRT